MRCRPVNRRGITLLELLVVVSILLMLLMVAAPMMTPNLESRKLREAARAVNVYLGAARAQAMQTGRAVGVMFERLPTNPQACVSMYQVEVPYPYTGWTAISVVRIENSTVVRNDPFFPVGTAEVQVHTSWGSTSAEDMPSNLVRAGDILQLGCQGQWRILSGPPALTWLLTPVVSGGAACPPQTTLPGTSDIGGLQFQIFRQPVRSPASSLELPSGVVVDLQLSGTMPSPTLFAPTEATKTRPIIIMFAPSGALEQVYFVNGNTWSGIPLAEPIYLLIGKRERSPVSGSGKMASEAEDKLPNFADPANYWLVISPQTGIVNASEVATVSVSQGEGASLSEIARSRSLANQGVSMGGK